MNIMMAGIDYHKAPLRVREHFACSKTQIEMLYATLKNDPQILGVVILSTCNRSELYLSCREGISLNPFELFCNLLGLSYEAYKEYGYEMVELEVLEHLTRVACGVESLIFGEDQIIAQVKEAWQFGREQKALDRFLEVLFRNAITAAKKIKTQVPFTKSHSIAYKTLEVLEDKQIKGEILIIGNGKIARLIGSLLIQKGYSVTITLRQYKKGVVLIPEGAKYVMYSERQSKAMSCEAVISATTSPHHTLTFKDIEDLPRKPHIFLDLAVPRDIDERVGNIEGVEVLDIDDLCQEAVQEDYEKQLTIIKDIIQKYQHKFEVWSEYCIS